MKLVVESAWKLGFFVESLEEKNPRATATAEPVLLTRCPSGNLSARRERFHLGESYRAGSAQPEPTSPRGEIVLSLRDCAGTSGALCALL